MTRPFGLADLIAAVCVVAAVAVFLLGPLVERTLFTPPGPAAVGPYPVDSVKIYPPDPALGETVTLWALSWVTTPDGPAAFACVPLGDGRGWKRVHVTADGPPRFGAEEHVEHCSVEWEGHLPPGMPDVGVVRIEVVDRVPAPAVGT